MEKNMIPPAPLLRSYNYVNIDTLCITVILDCYSIEGVSSC